MKILYFFKSIFSLKHLTLIVLSYFTTTAMGQGEWLQKTDLGGDKRSNAVGLSINSKGYIGLGKISSNNYTNDFWEYDHVTDSWAQKASFPGTTRTNAVSFAIGSFGYVGTGADISALPTNEFYQYNPSQNIWVQKANLPVAVDSAAGFSIDNMGYVGLGSGTAGKVDDFYKYDPITNSWSSIQSFPSKELGAFGFRINSQGYVGTAEMSNNFWEYNPLTDDWTQKNDFPGDTLSNNAAFVLNGKGYAATLSNEVWEFDPALGSWTQMANFNGTARNSAVGFSIGSKGYIGTGVTSSSNYLDDFWEYTRQDTFTADIIASNVCLGDTLRFIDNSTTTDSTNIVNWKWSFGDGDSSSIQHPKHLYSLPGNYVVKLIITDDMQYKDSVAKTVTVHELPVAGFTYSHLDSVTVKFTNNTIGAGEYYWQFGDTVISTDVNPTHIYATKGIYQVCLSGYNFNGCEGKICKNIDLYSVGIEETKINNNSFKIFPNPASGQVFLSGELNLSEQIINIRILDAMGKIVFVKNVESTGSITESININNLTVGFYLLEIKSGSEVTRRKLIVN